MNEKDIVNMYIEGKSTYQIAEHMDTYPNKIRRILIKNGIELKTKSEAQKNAIDKGISILPTKGKKRTVQEKLKISSGLRKMWQNMGEDQYQKHVERAKFRWENMSELEKENMTHAAIKAIQVAGKEGSKLEKFLFAELTKLGYVVEFHKKNLVPNQNLEIDMYIPSLKAIIEVDGPSHFLPIWGDEKLQKQIKADAAKSGLVLSKGFIVIRIKNLSDKVSLSAKDGLKHQLISILKNIEEKFPSKAERYIEVEI